MGSANEGESAESVSVGGVARSSRAWGGEASRRARRGGPRAGVQPEGLSFLWAVGCGVALSRCDRRQWWREAATGEDEVATAAAQPLGCGAESSDEE